MIKEMVMNTEDIETRVNGAYAKAKELQDTLNAVITFVDPSEQLKELDKYKGGKMYGVPIVLKDNVNTKGVLTTAGSKILSNYVPVYNACIADKLREAGAINIAKASMDELAMGGTNLTSFTGACHNPWDINRMAGGSSGGSAALVAAGVVPFAIGSDTGDSVRKPASFCGVVGVKPTYGRISRYGIIPYSSSLDHVGYFTRNIEDAAIALEVLAGRDDRDMTSSYEPVVEYSALVTGDIKGKKIAVLKNVIDAMKNEQTLNAFNKLMGQLKDKGAIVEEVSLDEDLLKAMLPTYYLIANCEATANHSNLDGMRFGFRQEGNSMEEIMINTRTAGFGSLIRKRFVIGSYGLFEENQERLFRQAQRVRRLIVNEVNKVLADYDAIVAPASGDKAPLLDDKSRDQLSDGYLIAENHMVIGNFTGYPSMTVPMGYVDHMPVGINITTKAFTEVTMFDIGMAIEACTGLKDVVAEVK
ncbi:MAG: Asp-tRNA(Asn)/Glu-tRNA(Gln) amidotransferase subunit GatA [Erysipelotrichaceae bacterium]|nr:Asp-tRNA(Asn)/Glu-tRNA(Gln) amidotransferase subunit GatA [Erysipelotrichaceae bacterium]